MAMIIRQRTAKLDASISIGVGQNCEVTDPNGVTIDIYDGLSNCVAVSFTLSYVDLCLAMRGRGNVKGAMFFNTSGVVGKRHENKQELVTFPEDYFKFRLKDVDPPAPNTLAYMQEQGFCKDGWEPSMDSVYNHHNVVARTQPTKHLQGTVQVKVTFHRYVEVEKP